MINYYPCKGDSRVIETRTQRNLELSGSQVTDSEGHPVSRLQDGTLEDIGGPFHTTRKYVAGKCPPRRCHYKSPSSPSFPFFHREDEYVGPVLAFDASTTVGGKKVLSFPPSAKSSDIALDAFGATAIARCSPTNPPADASTALGEVIREGLPSIIGSQLWKDKVSSMRGIGSEYLNLQFGWRPLVSEVNNFRDTIVNFDERIAQLERDSGKVVRRQYRFPVERKTEETNLGVHVPYINPGGATFWQTGGTVIRRRDTVIRRWFSGAFTYHLPSGYSSRTELGRLALKARLLGLEPTPDTVWNVAPWTWAIDWVSNAGDVVNNVSDFATQGLVMRYGYLMEESIVTDTYTNQGAVPYSITGTSTVPKVVDPLVLVTHTKVRRPANPFGFGLTWDGLDTFQKSILAALGITRGRR